MLARSRAFVRALFASSRAIADERRLGTVDAYAIPSFGSLIKQLSLKGTTDDGAGQYQKEVVRLHPRPNTQHRFTIQSGIGGVACLRRFNHSRIGPMAASEIAPRAIERIWGRGDVPRWARGSSSPVSPIGEVWFQDRSASQAELLVKYLFMSERLSIQVHPDDDAARSRGYLRGKDEAWLVVAAEPGAVIGLGLNRIVSSEALRTAALDGSIETLLDWRPAAAGDFFYSPAGTVHAIGAGLSLIEIQQNLDLTFRLYDYGRPREVHLDDAMAVANRAPHVFSFTPYYLVPGRHILAAGAAFVVERWTFDAPVRLQSHDGQLQLIPVRKGGQIDGVALEAGSVWRVEGDARLDPTDGIDLLAAYPGAEVRPDICVAL